MLFILTGTIQTGKTRWLQQLIADLERHGVTPCGVVAPGTWIEHRLADGSIDYEKTGIDNELLPTHERISFARRADLATREGTFDAHSQSAQLKLAWSIEDAAIDAVNSHFGRLRDEARQPDPDARRLLSNRNLLIVDELGRLELSADKGLIRAMELLDDGRGDAFDHALIVVRKQLAECAFNRFSHVDWGGMKAIAPTDEDKSEVFATLA